jgi:hypothetical protein
VAPGSHIIVVSKEALNSFIGRYQRWELRDTFLILTPGPTNLFGYLFRVPLEEKTVAAQVLKTGTGAINVDVCRISTSDNLIGGAYAKEGTDRYDGYENWRYKRLGGAGEYKQPTGRWPSNLLLIHHPECVNEGVKKVKAGAEGAGKLWSHYRDEKLDQAKVKKSNIADSDGLETIPNWICHPSCPVKLLDKQSGRLRARGNISPTKVGATSWWGSKFSTEEIQPGDSGGASRFFPQFKNMSEMLDWITKLIG